MSLALEYSWILVILGVLFAVRRIRARSKDPYGLFHIALNEPKTTEWLNMGYWKNTKSFPEAAEALARKTVAAARLPDRAWVLGKSSQPVLSDSTPTLTRCGTWHGRISSVALGRPANWASHWNNKFAFAPQKIKAAGRYLSAITRRHGPGCAFSRRRRFPWHKPTSAVAFSSRPVRCHSGSGLRLPL